MTGEALHALGMEFLRRVKAVIPLAYDVEEITEPWRELGFEWSRAPDLIAKLTDGSVLIIEAKNYSLGASSRVDEVISRLHLFAEDYRMRQPDGGVPKLLLFISGTLSQVQYNKLVSSGVSLIDGPALEVLERRAIVALATRIGNGQRPSKTTSGRRSKSHKLSRELIAMEPGRQNWAAYQRLCGDIFQYAFCPPLETPIPERSNRAGVNRRDYILPNYATTGFWRFARTRYGADHVVVDAKNYMAPIKKDSVLQIANYLNEWGCGLFGILTTRAGAARSATETVREQWIMHRKLILILDDGDMTQLLEMRETGEKPEQVLQQRIEDFRLSV